MIAVGLLLAAALALAQPPPGAPAAPTRGYKLAFNGGLAGGQSGWGTELSGISDVGARVHLLPWLGVGLSYVHLNAPNNEDWDPFTFDAFEMSVAWHPVVGRWFDPFVQAGALAVVASGGGYEGRETTSRFGLEGMAGFDLVRLPIAVGLHARSGFTNSAWRLLGLHLELRF
jgi:hypothetical protein